MVLFSNKDLYINFKDNDSKMILVTGISGSGKSMLSLDLSKKYNFEIISFDMVFGYDESRERTKLELDILDEFNKLYPDYKSFNKKLICNLFFDFVKEYTINKKINIIFDGSQFLRKVDFDKIKDQRIVLKRTSLVLSLFRRNKRNIGYIKKNNESFIMMIKEYHWLKSYNRKNIFRWIDDEIYFLRNIKREDLYYEK